MLGHADAADRAAGTGDRKRGLDGLLEADALEYRVRAVLRQLADALDRFLAALAHDVGGAELLAERDPLRVVAEQDDPLGAEPLRGDHAAQPDGAVADDGDGLAGTDLRGECGVVAGAHHVGEREQRRHQRVVRADRQHDQRAVCLRDAHGFALAAVDVVQAVPAAVQTLALQPLAAEDAAAVRPEEGRDDEVAGLDGRDVGADGFDDADELMAHPAAGVVVRHRLVRPEVAAADRGAGDAHERVRRLDQPRIRDVLDTDIAGSVHHCCAHTQMPPINEEEARTIGFGAGPLAAATSRLPPQWHGYTAFDRPS